MISAVSACPACAAAPLAQELAADATGHIVLSLPDIHCAACIGTVERTLMQIPGVKAARVNLSRKRVTVDAPRGDTDQMIAQLAQAGHIAMPLDAAMMAAVETDAVGRGLLLRLAVAGFAMMNVMLFSVAVWSGAAEATQLMFHWISAAIAVPALAFSAEVFFRQAWKALRVASLNMDVPISLAIILAAGLSVYETASGGTDVYFDAALSLTFFLLIGRYLDHRTRIAARSAAQELSALADPRAIRIRDNAVETVLVTDLKVGDHVRVLAGMRVPVDGMIVTGKSEIDRSLLTGESLLVSVKPGTVLAAGEVNLVGPLTIAATAVGEDTTLSRIAALVETAEGARNTYTALADRAARIYAPAVHLIALVTFVGWVIVSGDFPRALNVAISVLIITCPCALGLAVPAVMTAASGRLFRLGLLVKNGTALERLSEIDTVVFDKTGTLTNGYARIDMSALTGDELGVLAALAYASDHPVARAIAAAIPASTKPADLVDIKEVPGCGVQGQWNGLTVRLGKGAWLGAVCSPALRIGDQEAIKLTFAETLRDGAQEAVGLLAKAGLSLHIFSGDSAGAVRSIADQLGIAQTRASMLPEDKQTALRDLDAQGAKVLMVGDGLNDTIALAQAHVSISPASALDASRAASDIVLLGQSLREIPDAVTTAKSAKARIVENFMIAAGYNMIAVPIAVLGYASPLSAAIAMSASSITVLLNALRVR